MKRWHYTYAGLRVDSELPVPEWSYFEQTSLNYGADVLISLADLPPEGVLNGENPQFISNDEYRFHVPEVGSYRVLKGREIIVTPVPGAGFSELRLFLLGSAWSAICYQRNLLVYHAAAVRIGDGAVAFCGMTGMGKSSLTALLTAHGYSFVSDDLCRFAIPTRGEPTIYPSAPRFKLWGDALISMGLSSDTLERVHFSFDKFHLPWSGEIPRGPLPLRGIYLLEWGEYDIKRLSGQTALSRFLSAATYRGELLEQMSQVGAYWRSSLELVRRVPVWELKRPRDLSAMYLTVDLLKSHWEKFDHYI